jgi:pimeloyl-ACP methyl ester carboxylesterase
VTARSHFVVRSRVRLHHLEWGRADAHPIVLLHGVRLHAQVWNHFSRRFHDRYRILAIDQRGHGDSGWGPEDAYHVEEYYADLCAVVAARRLARFTLIGHSLGGIVSMLYASRHPAAVERLILVDITAGRPPVPAGTDLTRVTETAPPGDFASIEEASAYLKSTLTRAPEHMVEESAREGMRRNEAGRYTWKYDPAILQRRRPAMAMLDLWQVAAGIRTPTLLQYGSESKVVNADLAERMASTLSRCTVERIEGAGHALFTDRPEEFAASVERFLRKP